MSREVASTKGCRSSQFPDLPAEGGPRWAVRDLRLALSLGLTAYLFEPLSRDQRPPKPFMGMDHYLEGDSFIKKCEQRAAQLASPRPNAEDVEFFLKYWVGTTGLGGKL